MKFGVKVEGLGELPDALRELPKATGKNVLRRVGRAALEPMAEDARRRAPDDPSTPAPHDLKSSIAIGARASAGGRMVEKTSEVTLFMGPTRGGYPEAMPQEFGSAPHNVSRKGLRSGKGSAAKLHPGNPPHPYMRPAFDAGWRSLLARLGGDIAAEIEKARQRLARKAERRAAKNRS